MIPQVTDANWSNAFVFGVINTFRYTNWRGETEDRKVIPCCLRFGTLKCPEATEAGFKGYDEPQWLLECIVLDRNGLPQTLSSVPYRTFALKNIEPR